MLQELDCSLIVRGDNDRTVFKPQALKELAESIKEHGLAQPITVRPVSGNGHYQIVAGERRFRAVSQLLGWPTIKAIVRELDDEATAGIMLAENASREDLDPIDEALAYRKNMEQFGWSEYVTSRKAGVSKLRVINRLKLLRLRADLQKLVRDENLKIGYANIIAEADLDRNRQLIALKRLRENPHPTPQWFRTVCGELQNEQCQAAMFDLNLLTVQEIEEIEPEEMELPPHPETHEGPWRGDTVSDVIRHKVSFWMGAAEEWDCLGRPHKREECRAAAQALEAILV